ncbi:winged helix-turn-helix transcriptional regulator [Candidatus Woesearchaeota archaeon]|nr:winged helix-turn-helix transcriptional regulator [Candidatus Woesearchaeota archaeon]
MNNLDKKDLGILRELDFDARMSISSLAKKVRVSKEVANYRLKKLIDQKIIEGFVPVIDPFAFGYQMYGLHLRLRNANSEIRKELRDWVQAQGNAFRLLTLGGAWHYFISFFAKDPLDFNNMYETLVAKFASHIQKKSVSIIVEMEQWPYNLLYTNPVPKHIKIGEIGSVKLDETDKQLLDLLSRNARASLVELGQKMKLTANAVKYRIKALEQKKVIKGYRMILDHEYFKLSRYSVTLRLSDMAKRKEVMGLLSARKEVLYTFKLIGGGDVRFEMLCESPIRLYALIDEINALRPGIVADFDDRVIQKEEVFDYYPNN